MTPGDSITREDLKKALLDDEILIEELKEEEENKFLGCGILCNCDEK